MSTIDITDAVEAAARAQYERATGRDPEARSWRSCAEAERAAYRTAVRPHLEAAAPWIAARSLQDAATAFRSTRPAESARRSLEYPAVELEAMAHRLAVPRRPDPAPAAPENTHRATGVDLLRRVRKIIDRPHRTGASRAVPRT